MLDFKYWGLNLYPNSKMLSFLSKRLRGSAWPETYLLVVKQHLQRWLPCPA